MAITTAKEIQGLKHNGKSKYAIRHGLDGNTSRFYLWIYPSGKKFFYYKTKKGEWIRLNELTQAYGIANARSDYSALYYHLLLLSLAFHLKAFYFSLSYKAC